MLGQLSKLTNRSTMPVIIPYKDKTASVAGASVNPEQKAMGHSLGAVSFKHVEQVNPLNLRDPQDVSTFARLLVGTVKL